MLDARCVNFNPNLLSNGLELQRRVIYAGKMSKHLIYISDEDLKEILPNYLTRRLAEIIQLQQLFADKDYVAIRFIAHNIRGTALSYGLEGVGEIAALLEDAIKEQDYSAALAHYKSMKEYFDTVEVVYT